MTNILTLENVNKEYKKSSFSIRNISFSLPEGSILGFIGENGSGKSTTMNCILNVLRLFSIFQRMKDFNPLWDKKG
mgnify:CR=1 FL=1